MVTTDLTHREIWVLQLLAEGHRRKKVASLINFSENTVKADLKNILEKLDAKTTTHAVANAYRKGWIS